MGSVLAASSWLAALVLWFAAPGLAADGAALAALAEVSELPAPCPSDMVLVDGDYCPAVPYVCARRDGPSAYRCLEYARLGRCGAPLEPRRFCIDRYEWPNRVGEAPRVFVTWYEAKKLCGEIGKRLCRRTEWTLACEGPKRLPYPYGFIRQPSPCNVDHRPIPFDIDAMIDPATRDAEIARLWQADPIGSHDGCVSSYGVFDLAGNVDEWTDNQADDPASPYISTLNGGYWGPVRDTCRLTTTAHGPRFEFYQVGFRCCADSDDGVDL